MYFNFIKHTRGFESDPTISYNYKFPGFGFAGYTRIWKSLFCYKQDMKRHEMELILALHMLH